MILLPRESRRLGILGAVGLLILALVGLSILAPAHRVALFEEDRIVETLTAIVFLAAGIVGLVRFWRSRRNDLPLLGVGLVGVLGFLDELSFGERLFDLQFPRILGIKLDAAHDLVFIAKKAIVRISDSPYLVALAVIAALALVLLGFLRFMQIRGWRIGLGQEAPFLVWAVVLIAVAQAIDVNLDLLPHVLLKELYVEEMLELAAGLLLLAFAALRPTGGRPPFR